MPMHLIMGPMFSGKTTELLRRVDRCAYTKKKVCLIKHSVDTRYSNENVVNHRGQSTTATVTTDKLKLIQGDYDVYAIDEGQFFDDIQEFVETLLKKNKEVIVSCLNGDYMQRPFEKVSAIIPYACEIRLLSAICMVCRVNDAFCTVRKSKSTKLIEVGGEAEYHSVCEQCL